MVVDNAFNFKFCFIFKKTPPGSCLQLEKVPSKVKYSKPLSWHFRKPKWKAKQSTSILGIRSILLPLL